MSTSRAIPKFGSFKPKVITENAHKEKNTAKESEHGKHRRYGKPEKREHRHHHRRHRSKSQETSGSQQVDAKVPTSALAEDSTSLFVVDRRGDHQNLVYGGIHHYDIPGFYRVGAGNVLGAWKELKVDRKSSDEKGIVLTNTREETRDRREKYAFAYNEKKVLRLVKVRPDLADHESLAGNADFIPLRNLKAQKSTLLESVSRHSSDEDDQNYRSIEGKAKAGAEPLDEDLEWASDFDSSDPESGRVIIVDESARKKNIELSRKVDKNPQDVDAWIALINHQDNLLGLANEGRRKVTNAEKRSTADIKIHMYEKGLEKAGSILKKRELLLLGLMAEGAKIWDFKTQTEKWEQVSKENLNSILLWKQYLDFRQCAFTQFRQEELLSIYVKRIKLLNEAIAQRAKSGHGDDELYEHLIYILLRATLFLQESGYVELAVAIWQALLELNLFSPDPLPPVQSRFENFQEFWDSEVPRIGEANAKGWSNFNDTENVPEPRVDEETSSEYLDSKDIFGGWAMAEKIKAAASRMPARTLDDTIEDDPYRVILWSDIQVFMVDLSYSMSRMTTNRLLLDAFLVFCRLPPIPTSQDFPSRHWWADSFTRGELIECNKSWVEKHLLDILPPSVSSKAPSIDAQKDGNDINWPGPFKLPFHNIAGSQETMFMSEQWANYFLPWKTLFACSSHSPYNSKGPISYNWMQNTLKSLVDTNHVDDFPEYYLAFEACNEPENARKVAKSLLKKNAQSLRLYNAYAMIEWSRGNREISVNVMTAALGIRASLSEKGQKASILIWKTWAWGLLEDGDNVGALRCLFSIADGVAATIHTLDLSSPAIRLKTRQHLMSNRDYLLSSGDLYYGIIYGECLALIDYLSSNSNRESSASNQGNIESALTIFEELSDAVVAKNYDSSVSHELLLQSAARLLYHHNRSGPFRPAFVRTHLSKFLTLFPQNTIFLSLYTWNESRLRIDDRVRNIFRTVVLTETKSDNIISRLSAIRYEIQAGNVHSTRAAFENAVTSSACNANPGLWRLYVLFCASNEMLGSKVKETFFRGMTACPWAKGFYMMAFTDVRKFMEMEDLVAIYRVIGEKELRIHVDIDERLAN